MSDWNSIDEASWYERGRHFGERLADLARHRKPKDFPGPLIVIGVPLLVLAGAGILVVVLRSGMTNGAANLLFLFAVSILALVFIGVGLGFRATFRRTETDPPAQSQTKRRRKKLFGRRTDSINE